jgi:hypothetical protein
MAKPTGAIGNLDCEYCFFLPKEMLYSRSRFRMAQDLQRPVSARFSRATRGPRVVVTWQGCEPTMMGLDYFGGVHGFPATSRVLLGRGHPDGMINLPDQPIDAALNEPNRAKINIGLGGTR